MTTEIESTDRPQRVYIVIDSKSRKEIAEFSQKRDAEDYARLNRAWYTKVAHVVVGYVVAEGSTN
jgi:hypothetical protein